MFVEDKPVITNTPSKPVWYNYRHAGSTWPAKPVISPKCFRKDTPNFSAK